MYFLISMVQDFPVFICGLKDKTIVHSLNEKSKLSDLYDFINNKFGITSRLYYIVHGCKIIDPIDRTVDDFNKNLEDKRKIASDSNFRVTFRNI